MWWLTEVYFVRKKNIRKNPLSPIKVTMQWRFELDPLLQYILANSWMSRRFSLILIYIFQISTFLIKVFIFIYSTEYDIDCKLWITIKTNI